MVSNKVIPNVSIFLRSSVMSGGVEERQLHSHLWNISALVPDRCCPGLSGAWTVVQPNTSTRMTQPSGQHSRDTKASVSGQRSILWMPKPFLGAAVQRRRDISQSYCQLL